MRAPPAATPRLLQMIQRDVCGNPPLDAAMPAPVEMDDDLAESIAHAFRRLSPKLQIVAALALIEDRPYVEIAEALDLPVGTVKSRVFRAVRVLRKELGVWAFDHDRPRSPHTSVALGPSAPCGLGPVA